MSEKQYPPLPNAYNVDYDEIDNEDVRCYSEQQMRAYVDADRAQRLPLTDEQVLAALVQLYPGATWMPGGWLEFARAIEAAHGIQQRKESGDV